MQLKPKINYRRFKKYYHDKIMNENEEFFINNDDIKLEAEFFQSSSKIDAAALLVHPHPQFLRI